LKEVAHSLKRMAVGLTVGDIFFKGIRSVVDRLIAGGVQHIIIGSIFYRSKHRGITSDEYNSKAEQLNRRIYIRLPKRVASDPSHLA
jgi:hypothetical protein